MDKFKSLSNKSNNICFSELVETVEQFVSEWEKENEEVTSMRSDVWDVALHTIDHTGQVNQFSVELHKN